MGPRWVYPLVTCWPYPQEGLIQIGQTWNSWTNPCRTHISSPHHAYIGPTVKFWLGANSCYFSAQKICVKTLLLAIQHPVFRACSTLNATLTVYLAKHLKDQICTF